MRQYGKVRGAEIGAEGREVGGLVRSERRNAMGERERKRESVGWRADPERL